MLNVISRVRKNILSALALVPFLSVAGEGAHTYKWLDSKDGSVTTGDDRGWVDQAAVASAQSGSGTTYYVNGTSGSDYNSGLSATAAKKTIQAAIDASVGGELIRVKAGRYLETVSLSKSVSLIADVRFGVVIDGQSRNHCIDISGDANGFCIDGFVLTNGRATNSGNTYGGGVACRSTGRIRNCEFRNNGNSSQYFAGGLEIHGEARDVIVENCLFIGNVVRCSGGGVLCEGTATFDHCTIWGNTCSGWNQIGGFAVASGGIATIKNSIIWNNSNAEVGSYSGGSLGTANISYSCVEGGYSGTGNLSGNPLFVETNSDFALSESSPCKGRGENGCDMGFCRTAEGTADGLVAWFKFDGNANDSSGNGNHGVIHGASLTTDRFGNVNSAYAFGGDDWISVAHSPSLFDWTDGLTVSVWLKPQNWYVSGFGRWAPIVCKADYQNREGTFRCQIGDFNAGSSYQMLGEVIGTGDNAVELGAWQFICMAFDGSTIAVYKDGRLIGTAVANTITAREDVLEIGRDIVGGVEYLKGCLDDLRIYNRGLSAVEVAKLYNGGEDDLTVYHVVTFNANGGTASVASLRIEDGTAVGALPTATRSGYEFLGWHTSSSGGTKISASTKVNSAVTYYAHWERKGGTADDYLFVENDGDVETEVGEVISTSLDTYFYVDSSSAATITLSGLPTGLTYNKATGTIVGQTKKQGVYYVTCLAKNRQGYQMSSMFKWTVGEVEDADYDNIGLPSELLGDLCTGREVLYCELPAMTISGLPTGLKFPGSGCKSDGSCVSCFGEYLSGVPTTPGKFVVKFTEKGTNHKAQKTVIVRDGGSAYQAVLVGEGSGTVSGGGVKLSGATVKLSAKAANGYYFAGWYTDADCTDEFNGGVSGDYRTVNESFVFNAVDVEPLYAKFVTKGEDGDISISADDIWNVETEYGSDYFGFEVESLSKPTVTAKGLPAGVKLSGHILAIADTSKLKPGTSRVTLTAKNLSGATATHELWIVVPNLRSGVFDGINYEKAYTYTVGESGGCKESLNFDVEAGWTVTASGVPAGLKFNFNSRCGYGYLSGEPKKAGVYTVTVTAKKGSRTEKATFTIEVLPFPEDAIGTYGGDIGYDLAGGDSGEGIGYDIYNVSGSFSMTIAKDGKISVKFLADGKTVSLSGYSCSVSEGEIYVELYDAREENWCSLQVYPQRSLGDYQVEGSFGSACSEWSAIGQRNVAKTDKQMKAMVAKLAKIGKIQGVAEDGYIACPGCIPLAEGGSVKPNITFTVGADGQVKATGKIDGRSVSGSAVLQTCETEYDWLLYADFYDYKSSAGLLVYRAVFSWNALEDYPYAFAALYDGAYYVDYGEEAYKPVIYLYPETETTCSVKVNLSGKLTYTYPEHGKAGWCDFSATPDGTLTFADQSQYYCLFWEGTMSTVWDFSCGYCVKGAETASFLADVLLKMGLSFREANEFIIYWLPQMQDNPYNIIAFQGENYANAAKLEISPSPDSLLRVFMAWYPSARPVEISAPVLEPFERRGFTVVEWGGAKVGK